MTSLLHDCKNKDSPFLWSNLFNIGIIIAAILFFLQTVAFLKTFAAGQVCEIIGDGERLMNSWNL